MSATPIELAERVARLAAASGIETALIGAYAMAAHNYVRATDDIYLASYVRVSDLERLQAAAEAEGFHTKLRTPDEENPLGGVLVIWIEADDDGDPVDPVEVVNFDNPYSDRRTPARDAIRNAISIQGKPALRYPTLHDLVALKLFAGSRRDEADVVDVLAANPDADFDEIRETAKGYGFDRIDALIDEARELIRRRSQS